MELNPNELESRLLSSITTVNDVLRCQREGITTDSFVGTDPIDHGDVWEYIRSHTIESGEVPTDEDLKTLHGFNRDRAGDLNSYVELVRTSELGRKARSTVIRYAESLTHDPRRAIRELTSKLSELQTGDARRQVYLDRDADERLAMYDEARSITDRGETLGIPTGLKVFDDQQMGWRPGELIIVFGTTGVGKSWILMHMAVAAYYVADAKVLMISPELSTEEQGWRMDPMLARRYGIKLSNLELITGRGDRDQYEDWVKTIEKSTRFPVLDSSDTGNQFTFDDIWRYTLEFKPDVMLIDGLHLIGGRDTRTTAGWEHLKDGAAKLKALAQQEKIAIICAHQADRTSARRREVMLPPGLDQVAYGFAVSESANRVISLSRSPHAENQRLFSVVKARSLPQLNQLRLLHFDPDIGDIREIIQQTPVDF